MNHHKRNLLAFCFLLFCILAPASTRAANVKIGYPFYNPPFITSKNEGFDLDMMRIVCNRLHLDCSFRPVEYDKLYSALNNGEDDLIMGGLTISAARQATYLFSLPYIVGKGKFLVRKGSALRIFQDLQNKKIGVVAFSAYEDYLRTNFSQQVQIITYKDGPIPLIAGLNKGEIAAAFLDERSVQFWLRGNTSSLAALNDTVPMESAFGIMALPKNSDLLQAINRQLVLIERDGTYLQLYSNYFTTG